MADLFELDADTLATVENGINSLIHQLGKWCRVYYPAADPTVCINCVFDPVNNRSSGQYNGTGPKPFHGGKCPVCHGTGYMPVDTSSNFEDIQALVDWQPRIFEFIDRMNQDIRVPAGLIRIKGFAADLPKVMQSHHIVVDYANAHFVSNEFVRWGEPTLVGNIVKSKFFVCFLQRAEV